MRPLAAMGVTNRLVDIIVSLGEPPLKIGAPVSPSNPSRRVAAPAASVHTTASAWPSVVVTIGEPDPPCCAHQATVGVGGLAALIFTAVKSPLCPAGQPTPVAWNTTYVPFDVVYEVAA